MVRKVFITVGWLLLIGGYGYSEHPTGNFGAGVIEMFLGAATLLGVRIFT